MKKVGQFFKVSAEQYLKDTIKYFPSYYREGDIIEVYDNIKLPRRATKGSAGYDFFLPDGLYLMPGESKKIPTGIRVTMEENYVLQIYPRSSLGFKYRMQIDNTTGIIDSDYFYSKNEGHIWVKITNDSKEGKDLILEAGDAFVQGILMEYGITVDDEVDIIRNGGIGSTNG